MRTITRTLGSLAAAAAGLFSAHAAHAGGAEFGLNIDVQASNLIFATPFSSYGAAAGQPGVWNVVPTTAGTTSLVNLDGSPTGVFVENVVGGASETFCITQTISFNWSRLMCDQQANPASVVSGVRYEFTGLPVGTYDVYVYSTPTGESFVVPATIRMFVDGVQQDFGSVSGAVTTESFQQGRTHQVLQITVDDPSEEVRLTIVAGGGEFGSTAYLNGIQFVKTSGLTAALADPDPFEAVCENPVQIVGTADGPGFGSYTLEYSMTGNDPWTFIASSTTPVTNNVLGSWDITGLAEGYYTIRLTSQGGGTVETAVRTVWVNQEFDTVDVQTPVSGGVYGGDVCFEGTVWDQDFDTYVVRIIDGDGNQFVTDGNNPFYINPVINDPLSIPWDSTFFEDGVYTFEVEGNDDCANSKTFTGELIVDNTPPDIAITSDTECMSFCDLVVIEGFVRDDNLASWTLQYSGGGDTGWTTIASGTDNTEGVLAEWDVSNLPGCCYALRLIAVDEAEVNCGAGRNRSEVVTTVYIGDPQDVNGDGVIDAADLAALIGNWGPTCD
jgi:hypothetical protein